MKSRNVTADSEVMRGSAFQPVTAEETKGGLTPGEIRERAFEIHIERGGIHGYDFDDWMQAEGELREKYKRTERGTKQ